MTHPDWLQRTALLLGDDRLKQLNGKHILVAGLGGVGAYTAEMLGRAGIGALTLVDGDSVHPTNRNRQLLALSSAEGISKAKLMGQRLRDINPDIRVTVINEYIRDDRMVEVLGMAPYDYVVDAIDTLAPKIFLIYHSVKMGLKVISSMGAGGKTDPSMIRVADLSESYNCRLASILRKRIHKLGIYRGVKVVFSPEKVSRQSIMMVEGEANKKSTAGTISYMPPMFGCYMAAEIIQEFINTKEP